MTIDIGGFSMVSPNSGTMVNNAMVLARFKDLNKVCTYHIFHFLTNALDDRERR